MGDKVFVLITFEATSRGNRYSFPNNGHLWQFNAAGKVVSTTTSQHRSDDQDGQGRVTTRGQFARVRDLVGATGPNRFAIYEKFGGKEGLFYETLDYYVARLLLDRSLLCWQLHELLGGRSRNGRKLRLRTVHHYASDDSVFIDDECVIKGVAGRVLWRILRQFSERHRRDFSNKEIRLDQTLALPEPDSSLCRHRTPSSRPAAVTGITFPHGCLRPRWRVWPCARRTTRTV